MNAELYGLLVRIHSHVAVLGLALLLHPVVSLTRRPGLPRWTRRTVWIATAMIAGPFALGWWLYPTYREHVKVALWRQDHPALWAFESKEHLAALTLALTVAGCGVLWRAGGTDGGRRTARALLLAAWGCGVLTACLGIWVGSVAQPGW